MAQNQVNEAQVSDLRLDPRNTNAGTERGIYMLDESIARNGLGRSVVVSRDWTVIAGNKTVQAAIDAGLENALVVNTDGHVLVVVRRVDIEDGTPEFVNLAVADNRASEVGQAWDADNLRWAVEEVEADLEVWFTPPELAAILDAPADTPTEASEHLIECPACGARFKRG